jgi:hypothetical protein
MNTRHLFEGLVVAAACAVAIPAAAQQGTVVTTSGERVSGLVRDMDRSGFTVDVNGKERRIMVPQVVVVDFAGGRDLRSDEVTRLRQGRQLVILKDGTVLVGGVASYERTMQGALVDLPKDHAFRVHFNVEGSGERTFLSSEVARLYFRDPSGVPGTAPPAEAQAPPGTNSNKVTVDGTRPWTPTGITVRRGQTVRFTSSGTVQLGLGRDDVAGPAGSRTGRVAPGAPLPRSLAGALIGRIGYGEPFAIGDMTSVAMPAGGELFLGINDDGFADNGGYFTVTVNAAARANRR